MQDRVPTPGQEGRVLITPEDGSTPFYAKVSMADNPTQLGTPFNKESVLQDLTALLYGGSAFSVPDDIFSILAPLSQYWWRKTVADGIVTLVTSPNRDAYPDNGEQGGASYSYLGNFLKDGPGPKIETGTYVGTGTYGKKNPNTITISFSPKIVMIDFVDGSLNTGPIIWFAPKVNCAYPSTDDIDWAVTVNGGTFSWYGEKTTGTYANARYQLNESGKSYCYIAIG